nr:MAG TPA: hypothetical protein [Caudoviricetes sp.]
MTYISKSCVVYFKEHMPKTLILQRFLTLPLRIRRRLCYLIIFAKFQKSC